MPEPTLTRFRPDTTPEEAARLIGSAFSATAAGWPAVYFKQASLTGAPAVIDLDAMVRDAGALAVQIQAEADRRRQHNEGGI
jgi:hypothetical protein